jgi:three-Cys-motif partner protein
MPDSVVWELKPHTKAKHDILRRYLQAWFAIMGQTHSRIVYVDGFAGPGEYDRGEEGSPVIALNTVLNHTAKLDKEIILLFIESEQKRADHLQRVLTNFDVPDNVIVECYCTEFTDKITEILDDIDARGQTLAPTLAFIDPFGFKGWPFSIVERIMAHPSCEVLISFVYESLNRWIKHPDHEETFDNLFGTDRWREIDHCSTAQERLAFLNDLYRHQLTNEAGAKYVRSFEMIDEGNHTEYFLFFGTKNRKGISKMKEAMWKADPTGGTQFSDRTDLNQVVMFGPAPDLTPLRTVIVNWLTGKRSTIGAFEEFVLAKTAFRETHGRAVLTALENEGSLKIIKSPRKRARSYPPGTVFTIEPATGN